MAPFRLRVENLEQRNCPSATTNLINGGHTLLIRGNAEAETIRITQDDANNALIIESFVTRSGSVSPITTRIYSSSAVSQVRMELGAGDDTVLYQLQAGSDLLFAKEFWVETAGGNDTILVDVANGSSASTGLAHLAADLHFYSITGHGADNVEIRSGNIDANVDVDFNTTLGGDDDTYAFTQVGNLASGVNLLAYADGGAGRDRLTAAIRGDIAQQAMADVLFRGGIGDDVINAELCGVMNGLCYFRSFGEKGADALTISAICSFGSTGGLSLKTYGDDGNDQISETTSINTANLMFDSILTGGTGANVVLAESVPTP